MLKLEYTGSRLLVWFNDTMIFRWGTFTNKTEAFSYAQQRLEPIFQEALRNLRVGLFQQKAVSVEAYQIDANTEDLVGTERGLEYGGFLVELGDWIVEGHVYTK